MKLSDLVSGIDGFPSWNQVDKIKFFSWFLHTYSNKSTISVGDIKSCFDELHLDKPTNFSDLLTKLASKRPREILKDSHGFRLEGRIRDSLNAKFGKRPITVQVASLLEELPIKVPNLAERVYLDEALICLKSRAYRAAIVMAWNLAFHHLLDFTAKDPTKLSRFNAAWVTRYPGHHKKPGRQITKLDDFSEELKEREVIEICKSAGLISVEAYKVLDQKLGRRNSAAHPSSVVIEQLQAEEFIDDIVKNIVLKLG